MIKKITIIISSFLIATSIFAQVKITAKVDRDKILIGEPIELTLEARIPKNASSKVFAFDTFPHFEIMDSSGLKELAEGNVKIFQQTFTITSWDSGRWELPYSVVNNSASKKLYIEVGHTPFDVSQPYNDIKDIIEVSKQEDSKWQWYLIGIALLAVLFLLFFPKGKKKQTEKPQPVSNIDPYKEAITRLDQLKAADINEPKLFYTQLVNILRDYLHKKKDIQSFSKTTDDLSVQIGKINLPKDIYHQLVQTLRQSDMIKFAKFEPSGEEQDASFKIIRLSINEIEKTHAV